MTEIYLIPNVVRFPDSRMFQFRSIRKEPLGSLINGWRFYHRGRGGYLEHVKIITRDDLLHIEETRLTLVEAQRRYDEALRAAYENGKRFRAKDLEG